MPNDAVGANAPGLPEPRYRIAHLLRDPVLKTILKATEENLGPIPSLPRENEVEGHSSDEARWIFHSAYCQARVAVSLHEVVEGEFAAVYRDLSGETLADFQAARGISRVRLREALMRFAKVPAMTAWELQRKKQVIDKNWRKEAVFCDPIAADEAYLRAKAATLKEARLAVR
jgi:hypothetical protein